MIEDKWAWFGLCYKYILAYTPQGFLMVALKLFNWWDYSKRGRLS